MPGREQKIVVKGDKNTLIFAGDVHDGWGGINPSTLEALRDIGVDVPDDVVAKKEDGYNEADDNLGRWQMKYLTRKAVDTLGFQPEGTIIETPTNLKNEIASQQSTIEQLKKIILDSGGELPKDLG